MKTLYGSIKNQANLIINLAVKSASSYKYVEQYISNAAVKEIIDTYNVNLNKVKKFIEDKDMIRALVKKKSQYELYGQLYTIVNECEKIISLLDDTDERVPFSQKTMNNLYSLKEEFRNLEISDYRIVKNMEKSIQYFEEGRFLCSSFLSSRVISYVISQFKIDENLEKQNKKTGNKKSYVELIITDLINKGIIQKKKKKIQNNLMTYIKLSRDSITHNLLFFPEVAESLSILSTSILVLKIKAKYDKFQNQ